MKNVCAGFFSSTNKRLVRLFGSLDSVGIQGACGFFFVISIYLKQKNANLIYTERRDSHEFLSCPSDPQSKCVDKEDLCDGRKQTECTQRYIVSLLWRPRSSLETCLF